MLFCARGSDGNVVFTTRNRDGFQARMDSERSKQVADVVAHRGGA